jgi:hypothetical protein
VNVPQQSGACPWCSGWYQQVYHGGGPCPRVKAIEYYPDGLVRRVEFFPPTAPEPLVSAVNFPGKAS